jgi:hypothetical protein
MVAPFHQGITVSETLWFSANEPSLLLCFLKGKTTNRKIRLFAVACVRRIWAQVEDNVSRAVVRTVERFADGRKGVADLRAARTVAASLLARAAGRPAAVAEAVARLTWPHDGDGACDHAALVSYYVHCAAGGDAGEYAGQCALLRDIVGNLHRPTTSDPPWAAPAVVALAREMYTSRDFDAMPALGDALQASGCDDPDVLGHCRGTGLHARGCAVVDAILGYS